MFTMATGDITLFHELKVKYPEVPDDVLRTHIKQVWIFSFDWLVVLGLTAL